MSIEAGEATGVASPDLLEPFRTTDRTARLAAGATVGGTLAGMAAAATIPLWSDEEHLRPILAGAQRRARERGRREDLLTQQRFAVVGVGRRASVWTHLGGAFAVVAGVWFGTALVLSALGIQTTPLGIGIAAASWWIALVPVLA